MTYIYFFIRAFTNDDVLVQIDPATNSVSFVVLDPQTGSPVPASGVQNAISGEFISDLLDLEFTVPLPQENIDNAINVVLKDFQADQVCFFMHLLYNCKDVTRVLEIFLLGCFTISRYTVQSIDVN